MYPLTRRTFGYALCLLAAVSGASPARAYSTHQDAGVVIGQPDMVSNTWDNGGRSARSLGQVHGVASDGIHLAIADMNRVLIFNYIPGANFQPADVVVGQPDFTSGDGNQGGAPAANTLDYAHDVCLRGGKLVISEIDNNRVLIYHSLPAVNNAAADVVVGQPDATTNTANNGGLGPNTLIDPEGVFYDETRLFVADTNNNRVLIFQSLPVANNASADVVLGQPDMYSSTWNNGGRSARSLGNPHRVFSDETKLWIVDEGNHRILVFNSIPASNFASADLVLGQPDFTTNTANSGGLGPAGLDTPKAAFALGNRLFISDTHNNRVLIFNFPPAANFAPADVVLGQPNMVTNTANLGGISAATLDYNCGVWASGSRLWIADSNNCRVLLYDDPTATPTISPTPTQSPFATPTGVAGLSATATPSAALTPGQNPLLIISPLFHPGRGESLQVVIRPPVPGRVLVRIFDLTGRRTAVLLDADCPAAPRTLAWDGAGAGSGVYFVTFEAGGEKARGKIVVIR